MLRVYSKVVEIFCPRRDFFNQHGRHVCTRTEAMPEQDLEGAADRHKVLGVGLL